MRDTSNTTRDFDLDNTRQTVNTRDSILDFSKEEDDDDVSIGCDRNHDNSILFGDLHEFPPSIETNTKPSASVRSDAKSTFVPKKSIMEGLTLYSVTDSLVDSLCNSTVCMSSSATNSTTKTDKFSQLHPSICTSASTVGEIGCGSWQLKSTEASSTPATSVSVDVWQLLGCATSPVDAEMEEIWNLHTGEMIRQSGHKMPPARASIKRRLKRIHGLRMERVSGASRHGVTIASHARRISSPRVSDYNLNNSDPNHPRVLERAYSMQDDPLAFFIGQGIDPIPMNDDENDGYDSDPEVNSSFHTPQSTSLYPQPASVEKHEIMQAEPLPFDETEMKYSVQVRLFQGIGKSANGILGQNLTYSSSPFQRSLNSTWTLTWHPNPDNIAEYGISHKPICVNIWLERGTVIANSGIVVEPAFMWRDAYQPMLGQRKLNSSTQKPWSMRLLNACRITPCVNLDRTKYPFARQNCSFLLKSCTGEEFLLEAKGRDEVKTITERWKLAVARFASLAVTEDVNGIAREFFHPTVDSQMLTIPEDF